MKPLDNKNDHYEKNEMCPMDSRIKVHVSYRGKNIPLLSNVISRLFLL